jgi:hypothetical protein
MADAPGMRETARRPVDLGGHHRTDLEERCDRRGRGVRAGRDSSNDVVAGAAGGCAPDARGRNDVTESEDRRTNHALRRRIEQLLGRVRAAQEEIVERGLDAVQDTKDLDGEPDPRRPRTEPDDRTS